MKLTVLAEAAVLAATSVLPATATPSSVDPEHQALARRLVDEMMPGASMADDWVAIAEVTVDAGLPVAFAPPPGTPPHPAPPSRLRLDLLHQVLARSAAAVAGKAQRAQAEVYAGQMTIDQLSDTIAFFASPAGQRVIARHRELVEAIRAGPTSVPADRTKGMSDVDERLKRVWSGFTGSPQEAAFENSAAGGAFRAASVPAARAALSSWRDLVRVANAEYCGAAVCGAPEEQFFADLADYYGFLAELGPGAGGR